jgi:MoxR-like ATPase
MATQDIQLRNSEDARDNEILATLTKHIQQKLVGNEKAIQLLLVALIAGGHVLLEDDPGSGKTALSRAFSESLALQFKRVQCTPDLLPSDLTGLDIYQPDTKTFKFIEGPLFTPLILLTDELNRATPRTQSALLESMAEKQVTVDGNTHQLSEFFFVIATQNPLETAGTFYVA